MPEELRRRRLGRTKLEVTELTLGTWGLADAAYGPVQAGVFEATVEAALEHGIRTFDMAPAWGDGFAEQTVGTMVGARREQCVYVTRAGVFRTSRGVELRFDPESLAESLAGSLERLGTDYVDVLLLHDPPEKVLALGAWAKQLAGFKNEGRVRAFGVSCTTTEQARMALSLGADVLCMPYNVLRADDLTDLADDIEAADAGVIARSPLLHGLLTGRYDVGHEFKEGDHRAERWDPDALRKRMAHALALRFLVQHDVTSLRAAALRFVLSNPEVSTVALGPRNPAQLTELVRDAGNPPFLLPELRERVPQILPALGAV